VVKRKVEAPTPPEVVQALLAASKDEVLVGGQALIYWARVFSLVEQEDAPTISNDVDFLTASASNVHRVKVYAKILHGQVFVPSEKAMTALVGQAYRDLSDSQLLNVDVLWDLYGLDADAVRRRAVKVEGDGASFRVMHPLQVLESRLINLHKLRDKQNEKGVAQLRLAIDVGREFLRSALPQVAGRQHATGRSPLQGYVSEIEQLALRDAGRKVAKRYGIHVAEAIDPSLIPAGPFWTKRWPALRTLMSSEYRSRFDPPGRSEAW